MITVFATETSRRFHKTQYCTAFRSAQLLNDWDCGCWDMCTHRSPRLWKLQGHHLSEMIRRGKLPCWACYRGILPLPPSTEDFGHRPVDQYAGTPEGARGVSHIVCARCVVWTHWKDVGLWAGRQVTWPCTSAIVLGQVPRPCGTCNGDGADPEDEGEWVPEFQRHDPFTRRPCPDCGGDVRIMRAV